MPTSAETPGLRPARLFWTVFAACALVKLLLAALVPMTGDEAYFVLWGWHLDYGYYDHPPMVGWLTWLQLQLSNAMLWVRMPAILASLGVGLMLYRLLRARDERVAAWIGVLYLLSPAMLLNVFTLTDTGCLFFCAVSFSCAVHAVQTGRLGWFVAAGVALGLGFLSKYFAAVLGIGYFVYFVFVDRRLWKQGALLVASSLPFPAINLAWNAQHCWTNILFNFQNRHAEAPDYFVPAGVATFLLFVSYIVLPPVMLAIWRGRKSITARGTATTLAATLAATGFAFFALFSLRVSIGLHWMLWLYPMALFLLPPDANFARMARLIGGFSAVHVVVVLVVCLLPVSAFQSLKPNTYRDIVGLRHGAELLQALPENLRELPIGTVSYNSSAILAYHWNRPVFVAGVGTRHARQDDFDTDFRAFDGGDLVVLIKKDKDRDKLAPYFDSTELIRLELRGAHFTALHGRGFNYARYHDEVLAQILAHYYAIPGFLPVLGCDFTDRYFPDTPR